jgi:hypothetical protein
MTTYFKLGWEFIRCVIELLLLPFARVVEDRVNAARLYRTTLTWSGLQRRQRNPWSLQNWLQRAANRQQRINAVNGPEYEELQARMWERAYNYQMVLRRVLFFFAIGYGGDRVEALLREFSPGAYVVWMGACNAVMHAHNAFWHFMAQSVGAA